MIYLNDDIAGFDIEAALPLLSDQRREQTLKFRYELGRKTCAAAYLLLRQGLQQEYGITENPLLGYGEHGKPFIIGYPEIYFNLSHCREAVACAVSDHPVGIDVESVRQYKDSLVGFTMNEAEQRLITEAERPEVAFIRLWTMKEARLKLTGEGISDDIKAALDGERWKFTTVERLEHNYIYTVCEEKV